MKKNIVVIGAGLAGTLISNEMAERSNVTLLELGDKNVIGYPKVKCIHKELASVKTFCFGGGGTTNLWHNGLIPIQRQDIVSEDFKEVLADAEAYHDRAAARLYWPGNHFLSTYKMVLEGADVLAKKLGCFPDGIDCLLYPKKYHKLEAAEAVAAFYTVKGISFSASGNRITSVGFWHGETRHSIDVDVVIVSAGTFGSPQLVKKILSALGCSAGNVGEGLADHPLGFVGKVKVRKKYSRYMKQFSLRDMGNFDCRTAIRVKSECRRYTCCVFLRPALMMSNRLPIYKYKSLLGASRGWERIRNMLTWQLLHPDILAEIYSHLLGANIPGRIYNILILFEQKRGRSSVSYDDSCLMVDWQITDSELQIYKSMIGTLHSLLAPIADEINLNTDITEDWLWSAAHHSGTISMGDEENALVGKDLKLHACDNVFVCDGSVIQEHSYANTGLTIGSLAVRLADRVCCE